MTLHEYMAICFNNGQMVKTGSNRLCFGETAEDCHRCFPDRSTVDFWLRKHRYQSHFRLVDQFVSPSEFLRDRYIGWGIDPARIVVIENGQSTGKFMSPRPLREGETRNRFGFFGQINPFKGVSVLLEGLASLRKSQRRDIVLEIHGANLENQSTEFRDRIAALRAPLEAEGCLQWIGPYEPFQMGERMANVDWVVVPSIWWENSPMVIQEAFTFGRPILASNIGGMAEKIRNGVNGVHVPVGNARAWGDTLHRLAGATDEWDRLRAGIERPITHTECAQAHLAQFHDTDVIAA
jgi:glycosyltransferase involved in cell wall biosynthesis